MIHHANFLDERKVPELVNIYKKALGTDMKLWGLGRVHYAQFGLWCKELRKANLVVQDQPLHVHKDPLHCQHNGSHKNGILTQYCYFVCSNSTATKTTPTLSGFLKQPYRPYVSTFGGVPRTTGKLRDHSGKPFRKQEMAYEEAVEIVHRFSQPGMFVLDLCAGTFKFVMAAARLGLPSISVEPDSEVVGPLTIDPVACTYDVCVPGTCSSARSPSPATCRSGTWVPSRT